ncbi:MAG: C-GCAxxG-C-C family protein [bacterium]
MKKTHAETASEKFLSGYNCAQSVLWAFAQSLNLDPDTALKCACGFGAGMSRRQEVCGAVTGGIMVLGLKYGRGDAQDRTATELTYAKTQELMHRFEDRHGTCICRKLLDGCDLNTEAGREHFKDQDIFNKTCVPCVRTVASILENMLMDKPARPV